MEWERYEVVRSDNGLKYTFYSEGPNGRIKKGIKFELLPRIGNSTFNLSFGDFKQGTDRPDDRAITNNGDRLKVLHTVAFAVTDFLEFRPSAFVIIKPYTVPRARLYQMLISSVWMKISEEYEVYGKCGKEWATFRRGLNYEEFMVFRKMM
jgi:hypothetical protein